MRQRKVLTGLLTAFALLLMSLAGSITAFAVDTPNANRMNVVFVMDESGSMSKTDAESLRYDAMDLFLGLPQRAATIWAPWRSMTTSS